MDRAKKLIHAQPEDVFPYTGKGITAAILDTGISMHPDFAGRIVAFRDFLHGISNPYDDSGHGTHVAGCLAGDGTCSDGRYSGIAPGCRLVIGKVLNREGEGSIDRMLHGIRWVIEMRAEYGIKILNISVGAAEMENRKEEELLIQYLEDAWDAGIFVVVAAGNKGPEQGSLSPLGNSGKIVCVGCHDGRDFMHSSPCDAYSGRGPVSSGIKKPDIVAPGTDITSCSFGFIRTPRKVLNAYVQKSGTSMATPLISGAAALFMEKYPLYSNEQLKRKMLWTAADLKEPWWKQGWGMLQVQRMLFEK